MFSTGILRRSPNLFTFPCWYSEAKWTDGRSDSTNSLNKAVDCLLRGVKRITFLSRSIISVPLPEKLTLLGLELEL